MLFKIDSKVKLNNGIEMPFFGLGVYQIESGGPTRNAVNWAIEAGYRLFDTARMYGNEKDLGFVINNSSVPREEFFVTTKLWTDDHGYDSAIKAFYKSLDRLGLDYIDLYLIHWPGSSKRKETWKALETLLKDGTCKAIGVSNYTITHLKELLEYANIIPAINQVEFNPFLYQKDLLDFCNKHNIQLEAYSPLSKGKRLKNARLKKIAEKYQKSPAQIIIRWVLQNKVIVIPKSSDKNRIKENANVFNFEISDEDMHELNSFDEAYRSSWNPTNIR